MSLYLNQAHLDLAAGQEPRLAARFRPGGSKRLLNLGECSAPESEPKIVLPNDAAADEERSSLVFEWQSDCLDFSLVIECQSGESRWSAAADQTGVELEVRRVNRRRGQWRAEWFPGVASDAESATPCRLTVTPRSITMQLDSPDFKVTLAAEKTP